MQRRALLLAFVVAASLGTGAARDYSPSNVWSDAATAAALGYCLARHPRIEPPAASAPYLADGFEAPSTPYIVAAVRRNYVHRRGKVKFKKDSDVGAGQTCVQACEQWGKAYASLVGVPLRFRSAPGAEPEIDGLGDVASLAYLDADFYVKDYVVAAMASRSRTFHDAGDVAQADYCCCQAINAR
jgi:hypothetical protein